MAFEEHFLSVQVLYQLSWEGKLEHAHMIEVQYPSDQDGLRLKDVKKRLTMLRGQGINHSFSWSYKRNYKNTFIWNDLSDDDVIYPLRGSREYVLKASERIDGFANKPAENVSKDQNERRQSSFSPQVSKDPGFDQSNQAIDCRSQTMLVDNVALAVGGDQMCTDKLGSSAQKSGDSKEDEILKGISVDTPQNLPILSVEQDTIDVEQLECCLSSSDNEISPRLMKMTDSKFAQDGLVVMTKSPTVQGLQTLPFNSLNSPTEPPFSPGSAKRSLWTREIRKSLFGPRNTNASPPSNKSHESAGVSAALRAEASPIESPHDDVSFWRDGTRLKSFSTSGRNETKEAQKAIEKEKEVEQSTLQFIRSLLARWTGGSSGGKCIPTSTCEASSAHPGQAAKALETKPRTKSPCKARRSSTSEALSRQLSVVENSSCDSADRKEILLREELAHCPIPKALGFTENSLPGTEVRNRAEMAAMKTPSHESSQSHPQELRTEQAMRSLPILQVVLDSPEIDTQGGPPEADVETPKPDIARVLVKSVKYSKSLPRVKTTTTPKSLPPGFHKGTNDTKPVQTPRRSSSRNSIPLASPPLRRSLSKDTIRSLTERGAITGSPEQDFDFLTPLPERAIVKKCINFRERDERPLIPGLTTLDWEKALQEVATDCLPPPNFGQILQECSKCGRTFKPDSLQVHMRGCHPPQYARAFSARASPHMIRSRAL